MVHNENMRTANTQSRDQVIHRILAHRPELSQEGIVHLDLFGSIARGDDGPDSDIDICIEMGGPGTKRGLNRITQLQGLQTRLEAIVGRKVDLVVSPIYKVGLREQIERDAVRAF